MTIKYDEVKRIAKLSRIKVDEAEIKKIDSELNGIMDWIDQLKQANENIENVEIPGNSIHVRLEREDSNPINDQHKEVLQNAPAKAHNFFVVPKVVS